MSTTTTGNFPIKNVHFPGIIDSKISANTSYLYSEKMCSLFDCNSTIPTSRAYKCFLISIIFYYRCFCDQGYDGKDCDRVYKPCSPTPCQNGGSCSQVGSYGFSCSCPTGKIIVAFIYFMQNKFIIYRTNIAIQVLNNSTVQGVCYKFV